MIVRLCAWCRGEIPAAARRDALTCSKRCRQARHRFTTTVGRGAAVAHGHPRRLAYADPPYPGRSRRYYGDHPDYAGEVDHAALIASLSADFDAWALSTAVDSLRDVLALCPPGVHVAAWVRGARPHATATGPVNSWEPVIVGGAYRRADPRDGSVAEDLRDASPTTGTTRRVDSLILGVTARTTDPHRVVGAKPAGFARWIFELLDARPGDTLVDVFPGSGAIGRAWETYTSPAATLRRDASTMPHTSTLDP